jgi:hypothetical protein
MSAMKPSAGAALMQALKTIPKKKGRPVQLGTPPQANGKTITGASTSTTRIGY